MSDSRKSERYGPVNEDVHLSFWDKIKGIFGPDKPKSPLTSPFSEREGVSTQIESSSTSQLSEQERSCDGLKPAGLSSTDTSVDPLSTDTELDRPSTSQLSEQEGSDYGAKPTGSSSIDTPVDPLSTDTELDRPSTSQLSEQERSGDGLKPAGSYSTDTPVDTLSTDTELDRPSTSQLSDQEGNEYGLMSTGSSFTNTPSESSSPGNIPSFGSMSHPAKQSARVPSTSSPSFQPPSTTPITPTTTMKICPKTGEAMTEITVLGEKIDVSSAGCYFDKGELARILGNKPSFLQSVWNTVSLRGNPYEAPDRGAEALVLQQKIQLSHTRLNSLTAGTPEFDEELDKLKSLKKQQNRLSS